MKNIEIIEVESVQQWREIAIQHGSQRRWDLLAEYAEHILAYERNEKIKRELENLVNKS